MFFVKGRDAVRFTVALTRLHRIRVTLEKQVRRESTRFRLKSDSFVSRCTRPREPQARWAYRKITAIAYCDC